MPCTWDERRTHLLDAAARLFLSQGYSTTTVEDLAEAAGMSKKTIYHILPSKISLFDELLRGRVYDLSLPPSTGTSPREQLVQLLLAMGASVLRPESVGLVRLIITDGQGSVSV